MQQQLSCGPGVEVRHAVAVHRSWEPDVEIQAKWFGYLLGEELANGSRTSWRRMLLRRSPLIWDPVVTAAEVASAYLDLLTPDTGLDSPAAGARASKS